MLPRREGKERERNWITDGQRNLARMSQDRKKQDRSRRAAVKYAHWGRSFNGVTTKKCCRMVCVTHPIASWTTALRLRSRSLPAQQQTPEQHGHPTINTTAQRHNRVLLMLASSFQVPPREMGRLPPLPGPADKALEWLTSVAEKQMRRRMATFIVPVPDNKNGLWVLQLVSGQSDTSVSVTTIEDGANGPNICSMSMRTASSGGRRDANTSTQNILHPPPISAGAWSGSAALPPWRSPLRSQPRASAPISVAVDPDATDRYGNT